MKVLPLVPSIEVEKAVLAFTGWPDAGQLCAHVFEEMDRRLSCLPVALWDLDGFWQTDDMRPQVKIQHGQIQQLEWPEYRFFKPTKVTKKQVILGIGPEPSLSWRRFASDLLKTLKQWGCREVLLLGSLYDEIFYDEVRISGLSHDPEGYNRLQEWQCMFGQYQGPSAIHSALLDAAPHIGMRVLSLWAHLPFYLKEAHELLIHRVLEIIADFFEESWDLSELLAEWKDHEKEIEELLTQDPSLAEQIKALKKESGPHPVPSSPKRADVIRIDKFQKKRTPRNRKPDR